MVFDEVPGSPKGFRVLLNMFAGVRRNMTLGFPDHLTKAELSDAFREAYLKDPKPIPHEIVEDGPDLREHRHRRRHRRDQVPLAGLA